MSAYNLPVLREHVLFHDALRDLKDSNLAYLKNWYVYAAMSADKRTRWIEHIKRQATTGLPFAVTLVQNVTLRRLKDGI